jgi:hypothetical protein
MATDRDLLVESLRLPDSLIPVKRVPGTVADRLEKEKEARKKGEFIMIPLFWHYRLKDVGEKAQIVARHLLLLHFKNRGQPFVVANGPLLAMGVDRNMKSWALAKLERLGLIEVTHRPKKSPIVRPLHV